MSGAVSGGGGPPGGPRLSVYRLKRAAMLPRTAYYRWHKERHMEDQARTIFEAHYYRRQCYDFVGATMLDPDILFDFDLDQRSIVFDVGAFMGDWSAGIADRYDAEIYAFEPSPGPVRHLEYRFARRPRVHVEAFGLGDHDHRASLALAGPGSSIYSDVSPHGFQDVPIRDVVATLDDLGLTRIDLLKVNIEGGEYDLFDRLIATGWLRRIDQILVQFHEWHPRAYLRRWQIRRALQRGHQPVWEFPWVWELWRQPR